MFTIETYRDGFVVRTRLSEDGGQVTLPWLLDCLTHRGARRKARRHVRRLESERNPRTQGYSPGPGKGDGHGGWRW